MSDALDGKRAIELGKEEVQKRLADGTAYLDVVVKGKWIPVLDDDGSPRMDEAYSSMFECPECHKVNYWSSFCPDCGADLREKDCITCLYREDGNICRECEDGSRYLRM